MSEKPLLLSSAKSGVIVTPNSGAGWRIAATTIGLFVIIVGAADVASRLAHAAFGANANLMVFAPVALLGNSSLGSSFFGTSTPQQHDPLVPARLTIPVIGVSAAVEAVGKKADGSMATPQKFGDVAWYSLGSKPGQAGNAVIAGHVNNALTTAGVFEHLSQVVIGDSVEVADSAGKTLTYKVTEIDEYPANEAPADTIFATTGPSQLVLITCDGDWVQSAHSFDKRLVVIAALQY
jgi:LPXTG-site transpeptidase (sortase) family protein